MADDKFVPDDKFRPTSHIVSVSDHELSASEQLTASKLFSVIDADGGKNLSRDEVVAIAGGSKEAAAKMMAAMEDIPNSANGYIELHEWLRYVRKQKAALKAPGLQKWFEATAETVGVDLEDLLFIEEPPEEIKAKENMGILTNREQLRAIEVFNMIDKDDNQILTKLELAALFPKEGGSEMEKKAERILLDYNVKDSKNNYIEAREWLHFIREIRADHGSKELFKLLKEMEARSKTMKVAKGVTKWREEGPAYVPKSKAFSHVTTDDPDQLNQYERGAATWLFKALDLDGNELLTIQEVSKIITKNEAYAHGADEDLKAMFAAMEENDDGHISLGEWLHFVRKIKRGQVPVVSSDYKGQKGAANWMIEACPNPNPNPHSNSKPNLISEAEERVVQKPEDRKVRRILQGDHDPAPKPPKAPTDPHTAPSS